MISREQFSELMQEPSVSEVDNNVNTITFRDIDFNGMVHWFEGASFTFETTTLDMINETNTSSQSDIDKIVFDNCTFSSEVSITKHRIWHIEFNNCTFRSTQYDYSTTLLRINDKTSKRITFNNCEFESFRLGDIRDIQYRDSDGIKLCRFDLHGGTIKNLIIQNIELTSKFYINKQYDGNNEITMIEELTIKDSIFKENFKLHNCQVSKIKVKDTDFEKNADFYKSKFKEGFPTDENNNDKTIYFGALNFRSLALFGECIFNERCSFKYVTFEGYSHFRGAKFEKGLDLDYANIQKEMNFFGVTGLDSKESQENTSQETYRILKHNFQKIGNQIEANKYHALELDVHRQNTWKILTNNNTFKECNYNTQERLKLLSDIVPSFLHWMSSKYSQSWLMPIFWIFIVGCITNIFLFGIENFCDFNGVLKHISIINLDENLKDNPMVFLFNKISLGYLYYQFINATRKHIKK